MTCLLKPHVDTDARHLHLLIEYVCVHRLPCFTTQEFTGKKGVAETVEQSSGRSTCYAIQFKRMVLGLKLICPVARVQGMFAHTARDYYIIEDHTHSWFRVPVNTYAVAVLLVCSYSSMTLSTC